MEQLSYESRLILAVEALKNNDTLGLRAVAKIYNVNPAILIHRRNGKPAWSDIPANLHKLTDLEEKTIIQYIIELYECAFHPRLLYVKDMANRLLYKRNAFCVGI